MKIKLDETYFIEVNGLITYDVIKRTWSKKNNEYNNKNVASCSSLEQALKWYVHVTLADQDKTVTINEFIEIHKELLEETRKIARGEE